MDLWVQIVIARVRLKSGVQVEILTETMQDAVCAHGKPAREWKTAPKTSKDIFGCDPKYYGSCVWICEHMLEMD
jgi:hypothetical protein